MDVNIAIQHQSKIQMLFGKFLEPNFEIKNDTYLSRLLTHLSNQEKPVDAILVDNKFFSEWLVHAVSVWETSKTTPSVNISSFTLTLASFISRNENRFTSLNTNNFYEKLIQVVRARQLDVAPSVKLGYIKLLSSFLEHKSGIQWITFHDNWMDVLQLTLTNQTIYITKEGYRFMSKILEQSIDHNETFCHNVVKQIMLPLGENTIKTVKTGDMMEISDEAVYQNLGPALQLLQNILEYFFENVVFVRNDCRIVLIFLRDFHLEQQICNYMMIAQNKCFVFDLGKIIFMMQFLELYIGVISENLKKANVSTCIRKIMSMFTANTERGYYENVMKFSFYGQYYWNMIGYKIPCVKVNKDNEPISFANQLLVIQLLPVFALAMKYCDADQEEPCADEFRDQYIQKLFMMMCENTVRIAYSWKHYLVAQPNLFEIATKGLMYIMKSRKYYPRERAALVFQSFVYALKDVVRSTKETPEKLAFFGQQVNFFSLLFDASVAFIEEFHITWRDSVETICVMAICFDFLSVPTWPMQLVVKALKLVNVSLVKYMSPNLALLVDRTNDSTLAVLGPLLHTKLHDMTWEVRDSALEVVCTISHMSSTMRVSNMEVCVSHNLMKLKLLLEKILETTYQHNLDGGLKKFLAYLCQQKKRESTLLTSPVFTDWIKEAVVKWTATEMTPLHPDISCFTLSIASLLVNNEERFDQLNNNNFFIKLVKVSRARQSGASVSIKLAYINFLSSFLAHTSGTEWMIACNFWEDVFQLSLSDQNEEIIKASTRFISRMLEKAVVVDEDFCNNVVKRTMFSLGENIDKMVKALSSDLMDVFEEVVSQYLQPTLRLIGDILEYFLENVYFDRGDFEVMLIFLTNFRLEQRISDFMIIAQTKSPVFQLEKIMFIMQFLELYAKVKTNSFTTTNINATVCRIKDTFLEIISKGRTFEECVEFCNFGLLFWNVMDRKIPTVKEKNEPSCFADQLVIFQLIPYWSIFEVYFFEKEEIEALFEDEVRDVYVDKVYKMLFHDGVRACYAWRDKINARSDIFNLANLCSNRLKTARKYFSKERAIIVVQTLIYTLIDLVNCVKECPNKLEYVKNETTYNLEVFDILVVFIKEFQITWNDTLESINLVGISVDFLMMHPWPPSVIVQILRLINVAIANYMAPHLALLMDNTSDSTISLLGNLLYSKLHDEISQIKFVSFQVIQTMAWMSNGICTGENIYVGGERFDKSIKFLCGNNVYEKNY